MADIPNPSKWELSLREILNKTNPDVAIHDIYGYFSEEMGEKTFKLTQVVLTNGSAISVEGEHDFPYLADYKNVLKIS